MKVLLVPSEPPGLLWCRSRVGTSLAATPPGLLPVCSAPADPSPVRNIFREGPRFLDSLFSSFVIVGAIFLEDFVCLNSYFSSHLSLKSFSCRILRLVDSLLGCVQSTESWFFFPRFLFLAFLFDSFLESLCSQYQFVLEC